MDTWTACPRCLFSRESLIVVSCCKAEYCMECLADRTRCPNCIATLDKSSLLPKPSRDSIATMLSSVIKTCSYNGCNYQTTSLLIAFHESRCKYAAAQLEERHPDLVSSFCDSSSTSAAVAARRQQNILSHFVMYANVKNILAAQKAAEDAAAYSYPSLSTPGGDQDQEFEVEHLIVETDTLPGLALKYGTDEGSIRALNRMLPKDNIQSRVALRIPARRQPQYSKADFEELLRMLTRELVFRFKKATAVLDNQEALYYLDSTDFDFDKAIALKNGDDSWEASNLKHTLPQLEVEPPFEKIQKRRCCSVFG